MALFFEPMQWCARKLLDIADIVRDAWFRQFGGADSYNPRSTMGQRSRWDGAHMKHVRVMVVTIAVVLVTLSACTKKWAERQLVGPYHLVNPTACQGDVQESTLVLRGDGTYDQHVQLKSGRNETVENGHWTYDRTARRIDFSKFLISNETSFAVEASHPAVIFVNRATDCWYGHSK